MRILLIVAAVILAFIVLVFSLGGCLSSKTTHAEEPELACGNASVTVTLDQPGELCPGVEVSIVPGAFAGGRHQSRSVILAGG